jgi:hypothetical protein
MQSGFILALIRSIMNSLSQSTEMILYAMCIWFLISLWRVGNKWIEIHRAWAGVISACIILIFFGLYIYWMDISIDIDKAYANVAYILIPACAALLTRPLVITAFQKWFPVTTFGILYPLCGMIFTIIIGVLFYREILNFKQICWVVLGIGSMFLLK